MKGLYGHVSDCVPEVFSEVLLELLYHIYSEHWMTTLPPEK